MNGVANRGGWPLIWENGEWAAAKVASIVAGMLAGADRIDDLAVLRAGAVGKLLPGVKAPSTLGTFLRTFTFGHVGNSAPSPLRCW